VNDLPARMNSRCPACGCSDGQGADAHAILAALAEDDLDGAIEAGLLVAAPCASCAGECATRLVAARDARLSALAARERHRARQARLQRRSVERATARSTERAAASEAKPPLPSAAAAALARARARAARRHEP